jgi:hypothetical protein
VCCFSNFKLQTSSDVWFQFAIFRTMPWLVAKLTSVPAVCAMICCVLARGSARLLSFPLVLLACAMCACAMCMTNAGGWDCMCLLAAQRPDQCWRLGLHMLACCPGARPMLEAGTSLPSGQTNAGGWDFTAQGPDQCWRLGLHMLACCPKAKEATRSKARPLTCI